MPDPAKFAALEQAGFQLQKCCGLCTAFKPGLDQWGTCSKIPYKHEKHSGAERSASVPTWGGCPGFDPNYTQLASLGQHAAYLSYDT